MKRFICIALVATFLVTVGRSALAVNSASVGDVNCDFTVDSRDARDILKYHAGFLDDLECLLAANVDGYADVTSIDALLVLKHEAGLINHLPPIRKFRGTVVVVHGIEGDCLALDTGREILGVLHWPLATEGVEASVDGFLDPKVFSLCHAFPIINNLGP